MTREEAIAFGNRVIDLGFRDETQAFCEMAIKALEQEPCEDEIILTKEEYGQLLSSEFDNGYAKGYREALEQESILDKIRDEIKDFAEELFYSPNTDSSNYAAARHCLDIIDKYKEGGENA